MPCDLMMFDLFIFDLDGTLIDSAPDLKTACNKLLNAHGLRNITRQETMDFVGNGAPKLIERAFRAAGKVLKEEDIPGLAEEFLACYKAHETDETRPYEGVIETLDHLKNCGKPMALCTNKPIKPTLRILGKLSLDTYFDQVLGGDQVDQKKPDPQMINRILQKTGVHATNAVMVGDSPNDIDAARQAGVISIAVSYGYRKVPVEALGADHVVDRFSDILKVLEKSG